MKGLTAKYSYSLLTNKLRNFYNKGKPNKNKNRTSIINKLIISRIKVFFSSAEQNS